LERNGGCYQHGDSLLCVAWRGAYLSYSRHRCSGCQRASSPASLTYTTSTPSTWKVESEVQRVVQQLHKPCTLLETMAGSSETMRSPWPTSPGKGSSTKSEPACLLRLAAGTGPCAVPAPPRSSAANWPHRPGTPGGSGSRRCCPASAALGLEAGPLLTPSRTSAHLARNQAIAAERLRARVAEALAPRCGQAAAPLAAG
jgi:hypothetical protein